MDIHNHCTDIWKWFDRSKKVPNPYLEFVNKSRRIIEGHGLDTTSARCLSVHEVWQEVEGEGRRLLDDDLPGEESLPREFEAAFLQNWKVPKSWGEQ